jgi:ABC-2 type transport system ATP-binding protein
LREPTAPPRCRPSFEARAFTGATCSESLYLPTPALATVAAAKPAPAQAGAPGARAIDTAALTRTFDDFTALDALTLSVPRGAFYGFLGPNGSGKTTTIKILAGLLRPTGGSARVAGFDVVASPLEVKRRIGLLSEDITLYERLTGRELLEFSGRIHGVSPEDIKTRSEELLFLLDLEERADEMVVDYSQGMRKKASLAAALLHDPEVLLLDEPFNGVDPVSARVIKSILSKLARTQTTVFLSSHILEVVEKLCTDVAVIHKGKLVDAGPLEALRHRAKMGGSTSLEEVFLKLVDAPDREGALSWKQ